MKEWGRIIEAKDSMPRVFLSFCFTCSSIHTHTHTHTHTHRKIDRQTDRQTDRENVMPCQFGIITINPHMTSESEIICRIIYICVHSMQ